MDNMRDGYMRYLANIEKEIKSDDTLIKKELETGKLCIEYLSKILNNQKLS